MWVAGAEGRYTRVMRYVFTGTDEIKVRKKAFEWVALARTKAPDALYVKIDGSALTH